MTRTPPLRPPHPRDLRSRLAVAVLLGGLALSACGPDQLGAAAIVDGTTLSVHDLQHSTRTYLAAVPDSQPGEVQRGILQQLIVLRVIDNAAKQAQVSVSQGEVARQRDQLFASVRAQARAAQVTPRTFVVRELAAGQRPTVVAPDTLELWIRGQLLANKVTRKAGTANAAATSAFADAAKQTDVEVNPRYGRWDPQRGLAPLVSGDLSRTAAELAKGSPKK